MKNPPAMLGALGRMRGKLPWAFGALAFSDERLGARPGAQCGYVAERIWDPISAPTPNSFFVKQ